MSCPPHPRGRSAEAIRKSGRPCASSSAAGRPRPDRVPVGPRSPTEGHPRLAAHQTGAGDRARAAARAAAVPGLAHAAAGGHLRPVVRVQRLLDVVGAVRAAGADRPDLVDPLRLVDRRRLGPGGQALLLVQAHRVLAQPTAVEGRGQVERAGVGQPRGGDGALDGVVDGRQRAVVGPVGVGVPEAAAAGVLPGVAALGVPEPRGPRDRRGVGLHEQGPRGVAVAGVAHRGTQVREAGGDPRADGVDVGRGEVRRHRAVVVAVVLPPGGGVEEVGHAGGDDVGEVEVVAADGDDDQLDVVGRRELLQGLGLADVAGAVVVEVQAGLEVAARGVGDRLRARAGEVLAEGAGADEDLGGLAAVAAVDGLAAGGVPVRRGAQRVGVGGVAVRRAGPAPGLAGDVGVADADDVRRADAGPVGVRARGGGAGQGAAGQDGEQSDQQKQDGRGYGPA